MDSLPHWAPDYFEWFFTASHAREPRTVTEFCTERGLTRADVTRLENEPAWAALVSKRTSRGGFTSHQLAQVRDSLLTRAMSGDVKAQEIVLKMSGDYIPQEKREITAAPQDMTKLADADLWQLLADRTAEQASALAEASTPTKEQ